MYYTIKFFSAQGANLLFPSYPGKPPKAALPGCSFLSFSNARRSGLGWIFRRPGGAIQVHQSQVRFGKGHQVLPCGMLQCGHPVSLPGHRLLEDVAHFPGVAEVLVPALVHKLEGLRRGLRA